MITLYTIENDSTLYKAYITSLDLKLLIDQIHIKIIRVDYY